MANRTDKFPPGSCRMPEDLRMKRKKLRRLFLSEARKIRGPLHKPMNNEPWPFEKWPTGGSPFAPSRIPPVNQPKV
jgi:hypothetical protein